MIVSATRNLLLKYVGPVGSTTDAEFLAALNQVRRRFFDSGKWNGLELEVDVTPVSDIVTLPDTCEAVLGAQFDDRPVTVFSRYLEFLPGGPGEVTAPLGGAAALIVKNAFRDGDGAGFSSRFHFEGEAALALLGDADRKSLMGMVVEVRFLCPDEKLVIWVSGRTSCGDRYYSTSVELTDTSLDYDYGGVPETAPEELRERLDSFGRAMVEAIEERVRDLDHQIFTDLEEEYEYQTSEKNVQELSEANEWLYDENGSLI